MYLDYLIRGCDGIPKVGYMCQACNYDNYCFNDRFPQTSCTWTYNCKGYDTQTDKYVPWAAFWENSNKQTIPNVANNFYCDKYICNASSVNLLMEVSMVGLSIQADEECDCATCPVFVHSTFIMCGGSYVRINTLDWARMLGRSRHTGMRPYYCNLHNYNCPTNSYWYYSCYNLPYRIHVTARPLTGLTDRSACCCATGSCGYIQWDCRPLGSLTALEGLDCSPTPSSTPDPNASLPIITNCCYLNADYLNNKYGVKAGQTYACKAFVYKIGQTISGVDKYVAFSSCDTAPNFDNYPMRKLFPTGNIAIMIGHDQYSPLFCTHACEIKHIDPSDACCGACWPFTKYETYTSYPIAWSVVNKCFKVPIGTNVVCCGYAPEYYCCQEKVDWRYWVGRARMGMENGHRIIQLPLGYSVDITCHHAPVGASFYEVPYYNYNGNMI